MTKTAKPTGRYERRDDGAYFVFERSFRAPVDDVWAAITEPGRLARWIGTWTGDPSSGAVSFTMTAEGEVEPSTVQIDECTPPSRLVVRSMEYDDPSVIWRWVITLSESEETTTLTFAQEVTDPEIADSVAPGWDYYLDRLVFAETGGDIASVAFEDYYPAFSEHYRQQLP